MELPRNDLVAAPPDCAGHLGSDSTPDQLLQRTREVDREETAAPCLHRVSRSAHRGPTRDSGLASASAIVAVLGAIVVGITWGLIV